MSGTKRVVIIGAGPGGLASAMLLAGAGYDVTVLERQSRVGGRTATIGANGFPFDLGPTFFPSFRFLNMNMGSSIRWAAAGRSPR